MQSQLEKKSLDFGLKEASIQYRGISSIRGDGYLILPLSIARLVTGQSPEKVYEVIEYFTDKIHTFSNDVILLYTSGMYLNSTEASYEARMRINNQMVDHAAKLRILIAKGRRFMPEAFHYLPIEYLYLNSKEFPRHLAALRKRAEEDVEFRFCIENDLNGRAYTPESRQFILEEVAAAHLIRHEQVTFPKTLITKEQWRLFAYPGPPLASDIYQTTHSILPKKAVSNRYHSAYFDYEQKHLVDFSVSNQ